MTNGGFLRLLAFLAVVAVAAVGVWQINDRSIDRVREAELVACERVQLLRDQANGTNFLIYETFKQAAESQKKALEGYKTETAQDAAREALKRAETVRDTTVVTGPTNCIEAVDRPGTYVAPAPEFIAKDSPQVREARKRAERVVIKAKLGQPLGPEPITGG